MADGSLNEGEGSQSRNGRRSGRLRSRTLRVLGNCPVDNVVAAASFGTPTTCGQWLKKVVAFDPIEGGKVYTKICQEYGTQALADFEGNERTGELLERIVNHAAPHGAPTFVGWRDQELPDDIGPARTFQPGARMRGKLLSWPTRSGCPVPGHGPLEAILSGPAGEWNAEFFAGWPKPYPDVSNLIQETKSKA